ncbi:MAG: fimbrillin family protein [Parabacteroides sp.]|nr:fimbrillin family protein [Parabacteroides sp.]
MKYINLKTFGLLACSLLAACHTEEVPVFDDTNALQLSSVSLEGDMAVKSIVTSIEKVNIYTTKPTTHEPLTTNALSTYTYSGGAWKSDTPPSLDPPQPPSQDGDYSIYAYYPVENNGNPITVTNSADGNHTISVYVRSEDTFEGDQNDYLYAASCPITASSAHKVISLTMMHALAKVTFQIRKSDAATERLTLNNIEVHSQTSRLQSGENGTMNLVTGQLNGLASGSSILLTSSTGGATLSSTPTDISALMAPMSGPEQVLSFKLTVTVAGEATPRVFETKSVTSSDSNGEQWEAGKEYIYQIKVDKTGSSIEGVKVYDWKTGADQNTQVGI